ALGGALPGGAEEARKEAGRGAGKAQPFRAGGGGGAAGAPEPIKLIAVLEGADPHAPPRTLARGQHLLAFGAGRQSAKPCGWPKHTFGVCWQVVPCRWRARVKSKRVMPTIVQMITRLEAAAPRL